MFLMVVVLSIVVSLDGFAAALAYGTQRIRVSSLALVLISLASGLSMFMAMSFGQWASQWLPPAIGEYIGAALLIGLGLYLLFQKRPNGHEMEEPKRMRRAGESSSIAEIRIPGVGLVIKILRDPTLADRDDSGIISWQESIFLGIALALDAFGAGLGAALAGMPALQTAITIGICKFMAVKLGWELGNHMQRHLRSPALIKRLPGVLLICLGLWNVI